MTAFPALFASLLSPPLYSGAILFFTLAMFLWRGIRGGGALPRGSGYLVAVFLVFGAFSVLGPMFAYGYGTQNLDALKFLFVAAAFACGLSLGANRVPIEAPTFAFILTLSLFYGVQFFVGGLLNQDRPVYPPDYNNSAAMLSIFLPLVVLNMRTKLRVICLLMFGLFSYFVASRALLALTILSALISVEQVRRRKVLLLGIVPLALAILLYRDFDIDNFSDRLRLQIIQVSLNFATTRGAHAFNFGESAFTNFLNLNPLYRRMEIQHAHNLLLEIWVAYGIVPLISFCVFLFGLAVNAIRTRNRLLIYTLGMFLSFSLIEALITDVRTFGLMVLMLGYASASGAPRDSSSNAAGAS